MTKYDYTFKKISRKIYNDCIFDADARKALALLIFVKSKKKTGVIANYTHDKLVKLTGGNISKSTIKKRIKKLAEMELVQRVGNNLHFVRIRAPKSNINIQKLDTTSVKTIELGLKALYIVEIQNRKEYVKQRFNRAKELERKPFLTKKEFKEFIKERKFCTQCGFTHFEDNGISVKKIAKDLKVSNQEVLKIIKYGEKQKMFIRKKLISQQYGEVENASAYVNYSGLNVFTTKHNTYVYGYSCSRYILCK